MGDMHGATSGPREIRTVAMIGAGTMGWQISARTANSGRLVNLFDAAPTATERAIHRLREDLPQLIRAAGRESAWDLAGVVERVRPAESLADAVAGADLVIEAVR